MASTNGTIKVRPSGVFDFQQLVAATYQISHRADCFTLRAEAGLQTVRSSRWNSFLQFWTVIGRHH